MTDPKREAAQAGSNASDSQSPAPATAPGSLAPWAEPAWHNALTSPYYNSSHRRLQSYIRSYINTHILPHALEWEAQGEAPRTAAAAWLASGIPFLDLSRSIPAGYAPPLPAPLRAAIGDDPSTKLDVFHFLLSADETSRVEGGVLVSLGGANAIGLPPVLYHGTDAQKGKWLPGLFDGRVSFCLGVTEPQGGSDVGNIRTRAVRMESADGVFYVVNGAKKWITGAPWASHMPTAVRTGAAGSGAAGVSVLVIPLDASGVTIRRIENSGQRAGGASWVELDDVRVSAENLLGKENEGFKILMTNFNKERFIMAVGCNRKARTCLSHALAYAHTRETFGKPLIANQVIRQKLARIAQDIEAHWAWLEQLAFHVQNSPKLWQDGEIAGRVALAKVKGGRLLERAAREAQQVFGGAGYQRGEGPGAVVEQITRDLRMMVVGGGSEEILEDLAVKQEVAVAKGRGWKL